MDIIKLDDNKTESLLVVTNLKQGVKNPNRVNVYVNEQYAFSLDMTQVVDFKLRVGKELSEEELAERKKIAKEKLGQYLSKSGIVGVRSNMIAADLAFSERDFENAKSYWITAASKGKNSYTAALAYFNVAVCAEELNDLDTAISYYSRSADFTDFYLSPHARFSEGRVYEQKNDYANAKKAYTALVDSKPNDTWANLAKTRLLSLDIEGKVN